MSQERIDTLQLQLDSLQPNSSPRRRADLEAELKKLKGKTVETATAEPEAERAVQSPTVKRKAAKKDS